MTSAKYCEKCGAPLTDDTSTCGSCDHPVAGTQTKDSVIIWIFILFIPVINIIAIWFAPLKRFHKGALAGMVAGIITGIWVPVLEEIGVPYIIGTFAIIYYCIALFMGRPAPAGSKNVGKSYFLAGLPLGLVIAAIITGGLYAWIGSDEEPMVPVQPEADIESLMNDLQEDQVHENLNVPETRKP